MGEMIANILLMLSIYYLIKNFNTGAQRYRIIKAIEKYHDDLFANGRSDFCQVEYRHMESYHMTILRIWDWGCTRILPKEKFEIIKPYMK